MTATIINFPAAGWRKASTTIAATGSVIELWEVTKGDRCARIARGTDGYFRWRAYTAVKTRKPTSRQKFRPVTGKQKALSLSAAMTAANAFVAAYPLHR